MDKKGFFSMFTAELAFCSFVFFFSMEFRENYFSEVSLFGQHFHQVSKPPASPSLSLCHSYYILCGGEIQRTSLKNLGKYQESSFTTASCPFLTASARGV